MREISLNSISTCEGLNVRVVTLNRNYDGTFSCIYADIPASLIGNGICRLFSVKDTINQEEHKIHISNVKQFFVLKD